MDDMKDKVKGFMKKVNNPFSSSSSGKFKGQGRVLGSASSSSSEPTNPFNYRPSTAPSPRPNPSPAPPSANSTKAAQPRKPDVPDRPKPESPKNREPGQKPADGFDPFDSLITSGKRSQNGYSLNLVECPICNQTFKSEEEVSEHVDHCVGSGSAENTSEIGGIRGPSSGDSDGGSQLEERVGVYLSAKLPESSVEILIKLLRNIVREPGNAKFRRIRMGNPKIREAVGEVAGGVELLEFVGFELKEEDGEMWAVMEVPGEEGLGLIRKAVALLEPKKIGVEEGKKIVDVASSKVANEVAEPKKIDRQVRVYFSVPESVAARIELPDSFYNLSAEEVRREAEMRRKKNAESQLLIPKSFKEKQAKAARKRYNRTVIRIQFPDGVVLQGIFAPWESTGSLYEFVSSALKEPSLEFELLNPVGFKRRVVPHSPAPGEKASTLEDEDLVPSALIKFKPIETDSVVFTGLVNELLEISEPLQ
ncbi:plant UBX domain-containing protein 2 [Punica granatum]|uniref:UBX domain-containing protein n=2 Tax=Punica granatum TaxID=22663 RepID=A0A218W4L2_PUNGR|nr:plant UBX domain-containing protein 2 [Punica granatum]OWM67814.1 hypothetical protein CDL15_Pgr010752 [Punica granatum]PKI36249.1 hypothetical protein CRG98_043361 [Punica granatum]